MFCRPCSGADSETTCIMTRRVPSPSHLCVTSPSVCVRYAVLCCAVVCHAEEGSDEQELQEGEYQQALGESHICCCCC